ncbi:YbaK/EbsC family protein [Paenarthrobacter sp. DKR-5]|uniref:YbaK/EbsC family protein n=1 Tax=Paenarthrobacter sp. DKR-5 TaxID=2835535 RepID=UPI001BDCD11D|nr:YbaK/EbsC family protein [Paenarthrobacter sp. DKR-5]MBT1001836.1 YbaK/EbsC family protein [Paenarthrobacter sp. DKR-5]
MTGQPDPVDRVRSALAALGAEDTVQRFSNDVPTAADAARELGCDVAAIANSLVFELDGEPLLVLASGAARIDTRLVAASLGARRVRRASADFVLEHTGQQVGGVAPVGHPTALRTLLDASLAAHQVLWAGAGDHRSMFSISFDTLRRITGATVMEVR